jgi:DNA-binding response OmpR family regulator
MKRIVLVDDDPAILDAIPLIFDPAEYHLEVYLDGNPIIDRQCTDADLFILDKQLSGVDGIDLCRFLKNQEETKSIPVLIVSASPNIERMARLAGADAILEKPFSVKTLRELIEQLV